jgi:hypothetical protein
LLIGFRWIGFPTERLVDGPLDMGVKATANNEFISSTMVENANSNAKKICEIRKAIIMILVLSSFRVHFNEYFLKYDGVYCCNG